MEIQDFIDMPAGSRTWHVVGFNRTSSDLQDGLEAIVQCPSVW